MTKKSIDKLKREETIKVLSKKTSHYVLGGGAVSALKERSEAE